MTTNKIYRSVSIAAFMLMQCAVVNCLAQSHQAVPPSWKQLVCHGTKQVELDAEGSKESHSESTDTMEVVRRVTTLLVTINGEAMKKAMKRDGYATDTYNIASEGKGGLAATHGYSLYPTVHSLVVDSSGTSAVWTESALKFYSAAEKPFSLTVLFTCSVR